MLSCDLTERDLGLHGHGQSRVVDLAAEQGFVIQLGVEAPGQHGSGLHGAVASHLLPVLEVVERVAALDPAGKLPAHHRLWDALCGRLQLQPECLLPALLQAVRLILSKPGHFSRLVLQGQGLLDFGVVNISSGKNLVHALVSFGGFTVMSRQGRIPSCWKDVNELTVPFEVNLEDKRFGKVKRPLETD